ncbi:MAG TPA: hypothetical protein VHN18_20660 [Micromonosporaceae bacterium]|nr:hypothetical protein [Micromonosporaceae bacterium]
MTRRTRLIVTAVAAGLLAGGVGGGVAVATGGTESEDPITGPARARAEEAALSHTGGGRVTETEVGDEESYYEVEVTLPDGTQVDVQLDETFAVVGTKADKRPDDDSSDDGAAG